MSEQNTQEPTITIDGVAYPVSELSTEVKQRVALYQSWAAQLSNLEAEYRKTQLAVQGIAKEISEMVAAPTESEQQATPEPEKKTKKK